VAAGVAGLLVSVAPEKTSAELYEVMIKTAREAPLALPDANGHDKVFGYGIIDPVSALRDLLGIMDPPDAGPSDAGADAGPPPPDGGGDSDGGDDEEEASCACEVAGGSSGLLPLALLPSLAAVALARRRRRR
jgi:MYXO-CTERM domain-containing protein